MPQPAACLLIPGLASSPRMFAHQLPALWGLGAVMVANHSLADTIAGIAGAILALAPPRFHLAGLSMGGYVAFEILRQAPERVEKLALLNTAARADQPEQSERRRKLIESVQAGRLLEVNEVLWPLLVHESRRDDRALRAILDEMIVEMGAEGVIRQQRALIARVDSRPTLPSIRSPTLIVAGDSDALLPRALSEEMAANIPNARLEVVPRCGHLSTLEQPQRLSDLLVGWFRE